MKSLAYLVVILAVASGYPQFQNWDGIFINNQNTNINNNNNNDNNFGQAVFGSTTTPGTPTASTTPSPRYLACLQSCPATSEYNPICGSDDINYFNAGRLNCAIQCGQNVRAIRMGTCRPL